MGNGFDSIEGGLSSMVHNACFLKSLDLSSNPFHGEMLEVIVIHQDASPMILSP